MLTRTQVSRGMDARWLGAALAAAALAIAGCGDDGGSSPPDAYAGDGVPPVVQVSFPTPSTLTDTPTLTIRGTATDADDIAAVRVNGTMAESDDGFRTWRASVSLTHGPNTFTFESEDAFGARDDSAAEITVTLSANWLDVPTAVAADPDNGRALVLDRILDAVVSVDYVTGERIVLSDDDSEGPRLSEPAAIALDAANDRALILDTSLVALLAVDLATGARTVIADAQTGEGDVLVGPRALVMDAANDRVLVLDVNTTDPQSPVGTIYAVALETGDRTPIADPETGDRPALTDAQGLALDAAGGRVFVADIDTETDPENPRTAIYAVALDTGERTLISTSANTDQGRIMSGPVALVLDETADPARLVVLDEGNDIILAVDLENGDRTVVAEDRVSAGPDFAVPVDMALDVDAGGNGRLLIVDTGLDELLAVDLDDGARTSLSKVAIGEGPVITRPGALVVDTLAEPAGRVLVLDQQEGAMMAVDLATSERAVVSGAGTGSGQDFDNPQAVTLDVYTGLFGQASVASRAVVADPSAGVLLAVDLASGARTVLSGESVGSGPAFGQPRAVIFDAGDEVAGVAARFLVVDAELGALFAVDAATGNRSVISDASTGTGPDLGAPVSVTLELDAAGPTGRALVLDSNPAALVAVDLETGAREEISGPSTGDGAPLNAPLSVTLELRKAAAPMPPMDEDAPDAGPAPAYEPTGYALVAHAGAGAVLAIELTTGRRTELFATGIGKGPVLDQPRAVWLDPEHERMVIADQGLDALVLADRETGDRVIITR